MAQKPDLAGIYITDDYVDVVLGRDIAVDQRKLSISELRLEIDTNQNQRAFPFASYGNVERAFAAVGDWIAERTPQLRSIGIGCAGPFEKVRREDKGHPQYGTVSATSHGLLAYRNVPDLVRSGLRMPESPEITIETDVGLAANGYVYNRTRVSQDASIGDQVVVFVKASFGIGGAFVRASTPWHGRLHPEMGQCNVPRWPDPTGVETSWRFKKAMNGDSVEGLASVGAIEARYAPLTFQELAVMPEHEAWEREAWYLAQLAWTITCTVSPHQIVLGGRIIGVPGLIEKVRTRFEQDIAGRPSFPYYSDHEHIEDYLVASLAAGAGEVRLNRPGIVGALCLAAMEDQPSGIALFQSKDEKSKSASFR